MGEAQSEKFWKSISWILYRIWRFRVIKSFEYKLEKVLAHDDINYDYTYAFATLGNYYNTESLMRKLCTFVGFSVSLIFPVAFVSLIYFILLWKEKKKYESML